MKFALESKQVTLPSGTEIAPTVESISEAYEGLLTSYMELSDAQRDLDEVCQVMENIELSMKMIKTGGVDAIKILNVDKSLENLLNIDVSRITTDNAVEGLDDANSSIWQKFVEAVKKVYRSVVAFLKSVFNKVGMIWDGKRLDELKDLVENSDYNNLWAGGVEPHIFKEDRWHFESAYTKDGFKRVVDLYEKIVPAYLEYASAVEASMNKISGVDNVEQVADEITTARNKFLNFLATTPLGKKLSDGKPYINDDVNNVVEATKYADNENRRIDLGWKSKADVLATIGDLERMQSLKSKAIAWIPLIDNAEKNVDKLAKSGFFKVTAYLHDMFDTSKVMVIDSAKIMSKMTAIYTRMTNQMINVVKHFYSASK